MKERINGMSCEIALGTTDIAVRKFTLSITDNTAVVKKNGRPNGFVRGDVEASGELELDLTEFKKITSAAKSAGSFQDLPLFDINAYSEADGDVDKVDAFGCKLSLDSVSDADTNSADEQIRKVKFVVTSPDFININDVPYLKKSKTNS